MTFVFRNMLATELRIVYNRLSLPRVLWNTRVEI